MKKSKWIILALLLLLGKMVFSQQLRLGNNPYTVEKSAVLELVSDNQGLLLPRITDTSVINTLSPPDGMVIFYIPNKQLLLRTNGYWAGLTTGNSGVSSLNGNTGALTMDTSYISNFYSKVRSLLSATAPITYNSTTGAIGITQATTSTNGYLSSTDWNTFNNKQASGNYIIGLTGDVTATGPGSVAATISANAVTYGKMQVMTANKLLGSGLAGTSVAEITLGTGLSFTGTTLNVSTNYESPLTFSTGLTRSSNTITNNLSTGIAASNQTVIGSTSASGTLTLSSTSHATKGKILFGASAYDEANDILSVGTTSSQQRLTLGGAATRQAISRDVRTGSLEIMGGISEATGAYFQITGDQNTNSPYESSAEFVIGNLTRSQFGLFSYDGVSTWTQRFQLKGLTGDTYLTPNGGKVSVGGITPTANLHLSAGTATANTAPLKFTSGTNLTTPENGAIEYNGTNLFITNGGVRETILTSASTFDTTNISNFYLKVRALLSAGTGISYNNSTGVITNSGVTSVNGNTGALTMDTSYTSNFYLKVRSLLSATAPITYNSSTGAIAITQATTSTNGYLSSTDWNTFNNKQGSGNYMTDPGGNGIVVRTALNTTTNRTITGTANKITLSNGDGVSGNPTINIGSDVVDKTIATTYTGGAKQTFVNSATTAGFNLTASADPSAPASGDFWNSTTTANSLKYRDASSTTRTLVDLSLTQSLTNKTISGSTNVLGGVTMTMGSDATGDIYYRNSSGILTRLGPGSAGQFLNVSGGLPAWTTPASGFSNHNLLSSTHSDASTASVVRGDIITGQGASPTWSRLAIGSQGQILQAGATEVGYTSYKLPTSVGTAGQQLRANGTDYLNKTTTTYQATPADPATTGSSTGVMMGLAGAITPGYSGNILIMISGDIDNGSNSDGASVQIRYGTGTAPTNGAALTGTTAGSLINMKQNSSANRMPFHCTAIVSGLTVSTAYWIDVSLAQVSGGIARIRDVSISIVEL